MNAICQICGETFEMGYNGTVDGCDKCTGVKRDKYGYAWEKGGRVQTRVPNVTVNDKATRFKAKRKDAFTKTE